MHSDKNCMEPSQQSTSPLHQRITELENTIAKLTKELEHEKQCRAYAERVAASVTFDLILEHLPVPMVIFRTDGTAIAMNRHNELFIGIRKEEVVGNHNIFADQEAREKGYLSSFQKALKGDIVRMPPTRYNPVRAGFAKQNASSTVWSETIYFPLRDREGAICYVGEINLDVTRRQQAEEALRKAYDELEHRVEARTIELTHMNTILQEEIVERQRIESALRISEECFERSVKGAQGGVWDWNIETNEIYLSPNLKNILGYEDHEICNHLDDWGQYVFPDDRDMVMQAAQQHLRGETPIYEVEHRMQHRDGSIRWFLVRGSVIRDKQGNPIRMAGTDNDITERKKAEEALLQSEERYRSIITTMREGVILYDQHGTIQEWNNPAKNILGKTTEKLMGKPSEDMLWHAINEDGTPVKSSDFPPLVAIYTGNPCSNVVMGTYKPDGNLSWMLINAQPVFSDYSSKPTGVVATFTDITELKEAQKALQQAYTELETVSEELERSRDLLRTLFDGIQDGLVLLDHRGCVLACNQALTTMLGKFPRTIRNHPFVQICQERDPPFPVDLVQQTLQDGKAHRQREQYAGSNPRYPRVLDIQTLPIQGPRETIDQIVVHIVDVTEQLTLEAVAIQHERLAASGALAATVAHEINTPLQSINHCLFLACDVQDPQRNSYLKVAREEISRIRKIVMQLLELHRPGASTPALFNVNKVIERVFTLMSISLKHHTIKIIPTLQDELPLFKGFSDQLTQVIMNLILNAQKAMPNGGHLHIRTLLREKQREDDVPSANANTPASQEIVIEIEDSGMGMNPEVESRIFDPFFTTSEGGSGLGLTISQRIITQHGGYISVQSTQGQGSIFRVVLPLLGDT